MLTILRKKRQNVPINNMDLFRNIAKGKFGKSKELKSEAKHELKELGGKKKAEVYERALSRMKGRIGTGKSHFTNKKYGHD